MTLLLFVSIKFTYFLKENQKRVTVNEQTTKLLSNNFLHLSKTTEREITLDKSGSISSNPTHWFAYSKNVTLVSGINSCMLLLNFIQNS